MLLPRGGRGLHELLDAELLEAELLGSMRTYANAFAPWHSFDIFTQFMYRKASHSWRLRHASWPLRLAIALCFPAIAPCFLAIAACFLAITPCFLAIAPKLLWHASLTYFSEKVI